MADATNTPPVSRYEALGTLLGHHPRRRGLAPTAHELFDRFNQLRERVVSLEAGAEELESVRATLLLNFGPTAYNRWGFVLDESEPSTLRLLLAALSALCARCPCYAAAEKKEGDETCPKS